MSVRSIVKYESAPTIGHVPEYDSLAAVHVPESDLSYIVKSDDLFWVAYFYRDGIAVGEENVINEPTVYIAKMTTIPEFRNDVIESLS